MRRKHTDEACIGGVYYDSFPVVACQGWINRWIKTFLTPLGSDLLDREYGTPAGSLIEANVTQLNTEIQDVVALSVVSASEQVKEQDIEGLFSDNARLQNATIDQYIETSDGFEVWIIIENVAGDSLSVPVFTLGSVRS